MLASLAVQLRSSSPLLVCSFACSFSAMSPAAIALPQTPPSPSAESFPEALFRSTLGGSSRQSIPTSAPPPYVSRTTVGPPLGALLAQQKLLSEQHDDDEPPLPLHTLERQLYLHSWCALFFSSSPFFSLTPTLCDAAPPSSSPSPTSSRPTSPSPWRALLPPRPCSR